MSLERSRGRTTAVALRTISIWLSVAPPALGESGAPEEVLDSLGPDWAVDWWLAAALLLPVGVGALVNTRRVAGLPRGNPRPRRTGGRTMVIQLLGARHRSGTWPIERGV